MTLPCKPTLAAGVDGVDDDNDNDNDDDDANDDDDNDDNDNDDDKACFSAFHISSFCAMDSFLSEAASYTD